MNSRLLATMVSGMLLITASAIVLMAGGDSVAATLTVGAQANVYGAGEPTTPPAPAGGGGGVLPPSFSLPPGSDVLTFSSVTGSVSCCSGGSTFNGPDGNGFAGGSTNLNPVSGISGIVHNAATMFLVGVFPNGSNPTDPAPASLNFGSGGLGTGFAGLSPLLNQQFFIGDGLTGTGSGAVQEFNVPAGATTLFLGFADGFNFTGDPGFYDDNVGSLTATFDVSDEQQPSPSVPEPTTLALLGGGLLTLAAAGRRTAYTGR